MIRTHGPLSGHAPTCFGCHVLTVSLSPQPFQEHFNHSVGRHVRTKAQMVEALKRLGDDNSEATGITHDYEYLTPGEVASMPHPETADDHLSRISRIDKDPTVPERREMRENQRKYEKERASNAAKTKDLVNAE